MRETALETGAELLSLSLELGAMVLLSIVGILAERAGIASLESGVDPVTVWLFFVGAVALYAGVYKLGYQRLVPRVFGGGERGA